MVIDLNKPWRPQALIAVATRDRRHHIDERDEPTAAGFEPAVLEDMAAGYAVEYSDRYKDFAYVAIRGREQQLIDFIGYNEAVVTGSEAIDDFRGGAWSDTDPGPRLTENDIRGVKRDNWAGRIFHEASDLAFGPPRTL
jgi:hypothetical protein